MGHSQSTPSELDKNLEKLSESERQRLLELFETDKDAEAAPNDEFNYKILETHLQKYFSPFVTGALVSEFRLHCNKPDDKMAVTSRILIEIISVTHGNPQHTVQFVLHALQDKTKRIPFSNLKLFIGDVLDSFRSHATGTLLGVSTQACVRFTRSLFPTDDSKAEYDELLQRFSEFPVAIEMCQAIIKFVFYGSSLTASNEMQGFMPLLLPELEFPPKITLSPDNSVLNLPDVMYLNSFLPLSQQHKWRFLYSSNLQGESFSKLSTLILHQGPLLLVVRDQDGHIFGGYTSTNLECSSQYQGDAKSFLFRISPSYNVYHSTGYNDHYVYMNVGQETIPNGLAMGGQHDYFGLWLSTEFGKGQSKAKPTSTTFGSPQLSAKEDFLIDVVEAWGTGNEPKVDEEEESAEGNSVIDKNPDVVAILRIAGKEPASDGLRESDRTSTQPEISQLHLSHDPMN